MLLLPLPWRSPEPKTVGAHRLGQGHLLSKGGGSHQTVGSGFLHLLSWVMDTSQRGQGLQGGPKAEF